MKIAGIPREFKGFFNRFRDLFTKRQFFYFSAYIYGLVVMPKQKKSVTQIASAWVQPMCRSSLQKLLSEVQWEFQKVLRRARTQAIRKISHSSRRKRRIEVVVDDTELDKFGASVFGVGWYKRRKEDLPWRAIQIVVLGILQEDWFIPLDFRIYVPRKVCQSMPMKFKSKLQLAKEMLKKLKLPNKHQVEVMFDSWYLNDSITKVIEERGWRWYSRCRSNRRVSWEKIKANEKKENRLDKYAKTVKWKRLDYKTKRKNRALVGHQRIGQLGDVGRVKFVMTSLKTSGKDKIAFFCTNHTQIPMVELVKKYERRWKIEVYFRESRAYLALEHWYFRDIASVVHHLCLSLVSMIACFCVRLEEKKAGENFGTLGEFVRKVQNQNQRMILHWFLEQCHLEKVTPKDDKEFKELCEGLGI